MKTVLCITSAFENTGGIERYNKTVLQVLKSTGRDTDVLALEDSSRYSDYSGSSLRFSGFRTRPRLLGKFKFVLAYFKTLFSRKPQLIVFTHINLSTLGWLSHKCFGIPYIVAVHGIDVLKPGSLRLIRNLRFAENIWVTSSFMADAVSRRWQIPNDRFRVLSPCVDTKRFVTGRKDEILKSSLGISNERVLLSVTRLGPHDRFKGVETVLRNLAALDENNGPLKYVVVGKGILVGEYQELSRRLGISEKVVFCGYVPDEDLPQYYRLADLFILPSAEGFGIVYLEALASGVPVVAAEGDGSIAPLQGGKLGWRIPSENNEALIKACTEALQGNDQRSNPRFLRDEISKAFSYEVFSRQLVHLLDSLSP